jgi:hypothetical protein
MTWAGLGPSGTFWTLNTNGGIGRVDWEEARGDVSGVIDNLIVIAIQGTSVASSAPIVGNVLTFDGSAWGPAAPSVASGVHNLLSLTHADTVADSPVAGDLITGSGSPASWIRFPIGDEEQRLTSISGNIGWVDPNIILPTIISSGTIVNLSNTDRKIIVNKTVASSTILNLSTSPSLGQEILIKDGKGDANLNNIDVVPGSGVTIDSLSQISLTQNYQAFTLLWNGTEWNII